MVKSDFLSQERAVKLFNHSYLNFSGKYFIRLQYNQPYAELIAKLEMGCFGSSLNTQKRTVVAKKIRKPKPWKFPRPVTWNQLVQMRDEFWDTAPHHGGKKEIWDAIHAAAEADIELAQAIVDSAGVIVHKPDMTVCYDESGTKYEIPRYVLSEPRNLIQLC